MFFSRLTHKLTGSIPPLLLIATLLSALPAPLAVSPSAAVPSSVWGTKPILSYFLFTPDLAASMKREVGLSGEQYQVLQEIASQEAVKVQALDASSQVILQDPGRSHAEKQSWVTSSGYNEQVASLMAASQQSLQKMLGESVYRRLVDWIEARWEVERQSHGSQETSLQLAAGSARSYKIYATMYDSGGSATVALPDKCLKLANGGSMKCSGYEYGQNYSVKIENGAKSAKVTVGESGPWNVDDNFWATAGDPQPRRMFTDLPLGMPEAQAAYFDDYNGGLDQYGRKVTSPFAIDLSNPVAEELGLQPGQNTWVTVTFLWTEGWESQSVQEVTVKTPTKMTPAYSGDMCGSSWNKITGFSGSPAYLTLNVENSSQSTNTAEWTPNLPEAGQYRVQAFVPDHPPVSWQCPALSIPHDTSDARYTVNYAGGKKTVSKDQRPLANDWLDLGTFPFEGGTGGSVTLADLNGETSYSYTVSFSAVRFVLQTPSTSTPPPAPTPTATPTPLPPDPTLWSGTSNVSPGASVKIPIQVYSLRGLKLGAATLDIQYNPMVLNPTGCQASADSRFVSSSCDLNAERDGANPDTVRLSLTSSGGITDEAVLGDITFLAKGSPGDFSSLVIVPSIFTDPAGAPLPYRSASGLVCLTPCMNIWYFPFMTKLFNFLP